MTEQVQVEMSTPEEVEKSEVFDLAFAGSPVGLALGMGKQVNVGSIDSVTVDSEEEVINTTVEVSTESESDDRNVVEMLEKGEAKLVGQFLVDYNEEEDVVEGVDEFLGAVVRPVTSVE